MTTSPQHLTTDVLIVGGGPTGLYGAYYAGFRGLRVCVVDVLPQLGGQVMTLYPEKEIRDVAALPTIRGRDFISNLVAQAGAYDPTYLLGRQVTGMDYVDGEPLTYLDNGGSIRARAVVLAAGIGTPRPRQLPTGDAWLDNGLSYFVPDPERHRDQDVLIVGGGDSALDWADVLASIAASVRLVHRRGTFRGHAATLGRVRAQGVQIHTESELTALSGDDAGRLSMATLRSGDGTEAAHRVDHVIAALGFISDLGPLRSWGLELLGRSVSVDRAGRTNLPWVYAAGDVADYPGKVKLMSVGFGEIATAMNHIAAEIDPELTLFPGHSTDAA